MVGIRSFPFGARPIFRGKLAVSFRECSWLFLGGWLAFCWDHFLKVPGETLMDRAATISLFMGLGLAGRPSRSALTKWEKVLGNAKKTVFVPIFCRSIVDESTNLLVSIGGFNRCCHFPNCCWDSIRLPTRESGNMKPVSHTCDPRRFIVKAQVLRVFFPHRCFRNLIIWLNFEKMATSELSRVTT